MVINLILYHPGANQKRLNETTGMILKNGESCLDILYYSVTYIFQQNFIMGNQVVLQGLPLRV